MYRFLFTPRWLAFHLLVVAGIVLMVNLGFWQLRRLDERQAFNAEVASRIDVPPEPLDALLATGADADDLEWRPVTARGTYLPGESVTVVNRSQGGAAGDMVLTPLQLADGRLLLVERGFVPLGRRATAAPAGEVELVGRLRPSQERRRGQLSDPEAGELAEVQRVDIDRLAPQLPGEPVAMYVELASSSPPERGPYPQPVEPPTLGEGPHLSYAVQWFIFAAAVAAGWVLAVRKSLNDRRTGSPPIPPSPTTATVGAGPSSSG